MTSLSEETFERALDIYTSADTRRYHTKGLIPAQTVKEHTLGMLLLCEALFPNASANLLRAIIRHDLPESFSLDAPHEIKCQYPEFFAMLDLTAEEEMEESFGFLPIELTEEEYIILKFLDGFEVLCYLQAYVQPNWQAAEIFENQSKKTAELVKQLQARGHLLEPDNKVH